VGLGILLGLAGSTHYKAVLLLVVLLPWWAYHHRREWRAASWPFIGILSIAGVVFLSVNHVLLTDFGTFWKGLTHEAQHAIRGHTVPFYWYDFFLTYHWRFSLIPGMTLPTAIVAVIGLGIGLFQFRRLSLFERVALAYAAVSYFVPEISRLKPAPDESRYMLPLIPILCLFAGRWLSAMIRWQQTWWLGMLFASFALAVPVYDSVNIIRFLEDDTRGQARQWTDDLDEYTDVYTYFSRGGEFDSLPTETATSINFAAARHRGVTHLVFTSFSYSQWFLKDGLPSQTESENRRMDVYRYFIDIATTRFEPTYRSYAFSNSVVHIVDIRELNGALAIEVVRSSEAEQ